MYQIVGIIRPSDRHGSRLPNIFSFTALPNRTHALSRLFKSYVALPLSNAFSESGRIAVHVTLYETKWVQPLANP
jgi:hypothetical protein